MKKLDFMFVVYNIYTMSFIRKIKKGKKIYLAEVENERVKGKIVQRHLRYVGKMVDDQTVISTSSKDLQVDSVKIYGPLLVLNRIANKIQLPKILGKYSNEILSMVYAHCLNYKSVNNMPDWFARTDLNALLNLESLTESRLLSAFDTLTEEKIEAHQRDIFNSVKKKYKLFSQGIVYDVTNTYLYGTKCQMAKLGKSKDGKKERPLIQIGLAITQKEGIPVFHKTFDGNIHDSKTLLALVKHFSDYDLHSGIFIYDRGVTSAKNLKYIGNLGWQTLCGLPIKSKEKAIIKKLLKDHSLAKMSNRVVINKSSFYVEAVNYEFSGIKGTLAICYNERRKVDLKESRYDEISHAQNLLSQNKVIKRGLKKYLTPSGRIRHEELAKAEEFDGYSCIFSTKHIPKQEMISLYFDKDIVERAFKTLKGITHLRPIRHWLYNRVIGHVFICYLSYLLLSILKLSLKKLNISPEKALIDLESMHKVYLYDKRKKHKFVKTVALTKHQEKILKTIDPKLILDV